MTASYDGASNDSIRSRDVGRSSSTPSVEKVIGGGEDEDEDQVRAAKERKQRAIFRVIGSVFGLLLLLLSKLLKWLIGLGLLAGVGFGACVLLKPRITGLLAQRGQRAAERAAQRQLGAKKDKLEDELSALKAKARE